MIPPKELLDFLRTKNEFIITTHISPDGDGLGSSIALSQALSELGKKTILLCKDAVPPQCRFLPGHEKFHSFTDIQNLNSFENFIFVDCNDVDRIGDKSQVSSLDIRHAAVIDHHETGRAFGDVKWVVPESAATGLMIYYLIKALDLEISEDMAVNLYAAIATDTGNFRYENTSPMVFRVADELTRLGAKPHLAYRELFESWSQGRFELFVRVLNTLDKHDGIGTIVVTRKMLDETGTSPDDTEHFVEFPRIMKDLDISILLREIDANNYKLSLRSKEDINVATIAQSFGGGGHKNAAGCRIKADLETAKAQVLSQVKLLAKG